MKRVMTLLLIAVFALTAPALSLGKMSPGEFIDINGHWGEKSIRNAEQLGLMNGAGSTEDGLFRIFAPENTVNRAQMATVLVRVFQLDGAIGDEKIGDYYRDVDKDVWYAEAALICAVNQVFAPGDYFYPQQEVSRLEVARAVQKCFTVKNVSMPMIMMLPVYSDMDKLSQEDINALAFVSNTGIMSGDGWYFRPAASIKRAELAKVLNSCASLLALNETHNGKAYSLAAGESFLLSLDSNPSNGYSWTLDSSWNQELLELSSKGYLDTENRNAVGQGGQEFWRFKALKAGETEIKLIYSRPWESVQPLKTFTLKVEFIESPELKEGLKVSLNEVKEKSEIFEIDLNIPLVSGLADEEVQAEINNLFEQEAMEIIPQMEKEAQEYAEEAEQAGFPLHPFQYVSRYQLMTQTGDFLSLYVDYYQYTGGAHGLTERRAYNIDLETGKLKALKDFFPKNYNYYDPINKEIARQIKENPEIYFAGEMGFHGIDKEQGYYIQDGNLLIFFDQYEIAPYASGIPEFVIPLSGL